MGGFRVIKRKSPDYPMEDENKTSNTLVVGLGNELLSDDGVGIKAARALREELQSQADVIECSESGLALLDLLEGYKRVLLLDAISTAQHPPGTILEFCAEDLQRPLAPSPHFMGIPELVQLAKRLGIPFPEKINILAMEAENVYELGDSLSAAVELALPKFLQKGREAVARMNLEAES
jgi:hydrogenase maturation protease